MTTEQMTLEQTEHKLRKKLVEFKHSSDPYRAMLGSTLLDTCSGLSGQAFFDALGSATDGFDDSLVSFNLFWMKIAGEM